MNVCYVTMVFPATSETFACLDVRMLRESGVSVSVYAMRSARPRGKEMLADRGLGDLPLSHGTWAAKLRGVRFAATHPSTTLDLIAWIWRHNWQSPGQLLKSLALVPRSLDIFVAIQRERPDVVHLFWGHYPAIVGYLVRRHVSGIVVSMFLGAYDLRQRYAGSGALGRIVDVVWTHAHVNTRAIEDLGVPGPHIRVVHRGIDVEAFSRQRCEKTRERFITAGRLSEEKAVHQVLAVFAKTRERRPDASLGVLGDGPERSRLISLAASLGIGPAVTFRGHVTPEEVRDEMAAAQVFLLMSVVECLPNVVKEAMASGCACVVAETPGIEELVKDGVSGFVVPREDVDTATRRVDELLRHPERMAAMAAAARDHVRAQFDVRRSMQLYQECWRELVARRRLGSVAVTRRSQALSQGPPGEASATRRGQHSPGRAATPGT